VYGDRLSSTSGSVQSPATKRLVHFQAIWMQFWQAFSGNLSLVIVFFWGGGQLRAGDSSDSQYSVASTWHHLLVFVCMCVYSATGSQPINILYFSP